MSAPVNTEAARAILREIASSAVRIATLSSQAFDNGDKADTLDAYLSAMEVMAQRMGWLADLAAAHLGERVAVVGTDARAWLLPDYCKAPRVEGQRHG